MTTTAPNPVGWAIAAEVQSATVHYVSDFSFLAQFFTADGTWTGSPYSGIDIETEGVLSPHDGEIATVQVEVFGQCWVVHWDADKTITEVPGAEWLRYYLTHPQVTKVIHNAKFEVAWFTDAFGWMCEVAPVHDTMAGEYLLAEGSSFGSTTIVLDKGAMGLGSIVARRYGVEMDKDTELRTGFRRRHTTYTVQAVKSYPKAHPTGACRCGTYMAEFIVGSRGEHWLCSYCVAEPEFKRYRTKLPIDQTLYQTHVATQLDLTPRQLSYAAFDALWCAKVAQDQLVTMVAQKAAGGYGRNNLELLKLDSDAACVLGRMEWHGMPVNKEELWWLDQRFKAEEETLREDLEEELTRWEPMWVPAQAHPGSYTPNEHGVIPPRYWLDETGATIDVYPETPGYWVPADKAPINLLSAEQMLQRLTELGIHTPDYSAPELKRLSDDFPIVAKILKWKKLQKATSTYTEPWLEKIHPKTGRIHCGFNQFFTATGRLSSSGPNLQNVPSKGDAAEIRETVQVESDEWVVIIADYSQIELRLIAEKYRDMMMQQAFLQGKDIHAMMGAQIIGISYEEMLARVAAGDKDAKKARSNAKPANFGLGYGAGVNQLIVIAWNQYDIAWNTSEAGRIRSAYLGLWSGVAAYHKSVADEIKYGSGDFYRETHDGRVRRMPRNWVDKKTEKTKSCYSAAMNHPIQGTSGDITKEAMVMLDKIYLHEFGGNARLFLQVHDELVTYCRKDIAEQVLARKKQIMEWVGQKRLAIVPCVVDAKISDKWEK